MERTFARYLFATLLAMINVFAVRTVAGKSSMVTLVVQIAEQE
jgi:hypothetical protein